MDNPPVLICGGSLAGLACAIRLKQLGIDSLILEQRQFPREKLCGEFLGPDAIACLDALGLWQLVQPEAYGPVESIRLYNQTGKALTIKTGWIRQDYPYGAALSRDRLDTLLSKAARHKGVRIIEKSRVIACQTQGKGFEVIAESNQQQSRYHCDFFVDASGRNTKFYRQHKASQSVGLQFHARLPKSSTSTELNMFLFEGGYAGIQPIGREQVNICMLLQPQLAKQAANDIDGYLEVTLRKNPAARELLDGLTLEGKIHSTTVSNMNRHNTKPPFIHIGDAMITVDPFTGFGMAHALKTGDLSAQHIQKGLKTGFSYPKVKTNYYEDYQRFFGTHLKLVHFLRPGLESKFIQNVLWPLLPPVLPLLSKLYR